MAYVNHFKVVFLVWVVAIDSIGGYLLGNLMQKHKSCLRTQKLIPKIN